MKYTLLFLSFFFFLLTQAQSKERVDKNLAILMYADSLLASPENWTKEGCFKICSNGGKYTLQCALVEASIIVNDKYKHRGLASRTLRKTIIKDLPYKVKHPIYDYNKEGHTSFSNIKEILNQAISKLKNH